MRRAGLALVWAIAATVSCGDPGDPAVAESASSSELVGPTTLAGPTTLFVPGPPTTDPPMTMEPGYTGTVPPPPSVPISVEPTVDLSDRAAGQAYLVGDVGPPEDVEQIKANLAEQVAAVERLCAVPLGFVADAEDVASRLRRLDELVEPASPVRRTPERCIPGLPTAWDDPDFVGYADARVAVDRWVAVQIRADGLGAVVVFEGRLEYLNNHVEGMSGGGWHAWADGTFVYLLVRSSASSPWRLSDLDVPYQI